MAQLIRQAQREDIIRLREICCQTVAERPFLPYCEEPRFAPIFFLEPYLAIEMGSCFVAEIDGLIVGYVVGTVNVLRFESDLNSYFRSRLGEIVKLQLCGAAKLAVKHRVSHKILLRRYIDIVSGSVHESAAVGQHIDLSRFPAHCHLQIAPDAREKRVGLLLMLRFHKHLRDSGVLGQYSTVTEQVGHEGYSQMLLAMGFHVVREGTFTARERPALQHSGTWRDRILVRKF